jgi:hypothetical protein
MERHISGRTDGQTERKTDSKLQVQRDKQTYYKFVKGLMIHII